MTEKQLTKYIHVGEYVAEVDVTLIVTDDEWSPYLSLEDARRLDNVRTALQSGDLQEAAKFGQIFRMMPVAG